MIAGQTAEATTRVLVVEDEALIAEEISDRLTRLNYEVMGIEDTGPRALEAVRHHGVDLVLMDIRLKGPMDGIETARQIRCESDVPIIYVTAHADQATLARAKATSPLGYVLKPFQERDLVMLEMALHRHRQEQELRRSEVHYAATLASLSEAVVVADTQGRVTFMNRSATALTAHAASDALGKPIEQVVTVVHETSRETLESPTKRALLENATVTPDAPALLLAADGRSIPIDDSAAPILTDDGRVSGVVLAFHDISERRSAEAEQRRALEQQFQAQKMEAIGSLAGGVAHDFNNLLTVIGGSTEVLLERRSLTRDDQVLAEEIFSATERATRLTRQLLTFSRRQILQTKVFDLNQLIQGVHELLFQIVGPGIDVKLQLDPELAPIRVDPLQFEQVLLNFALNARDAMPEGGELLLVTSSLSSAEKRATLPNLSVGSVVLCVSDTGTGMTQAVRERIFEPFFTTKAHGKGTGLGLATVHGIVSQSGGDIQVESELGKGTTFKLTFPAVNESLAATPRQREYVQPGGETILLAEDEDGIRSIATLALSRQGYRVLSARDGEEALEIWEARAAEIDMLVTDVMMPSMGGRRLAELISAARPTIPILFISGYTDDTLVRLGVEGGSTSFLQKPFTSAALTCKVRDILELAALARRRLLS